jgi:hypothetical protein
MSVVIHLSIAIHDFFLRNIFSLIEIFFPIAFSTRRELKRRDRVMKLKNFQYLFLMVAFFVF